MGLDYWRQIDILPPSELEGLHLIIIGAGGISSPTAFSLAKMGFPKITVYDEDTVARHNLNTTIYRKRDEGKFKVLALKEIIEESSDTEVIAIPRMFSAKDKVRGIVISGVDSMKARAEIWTAVKLNNIHIPIYIDGRMGAQLLRVFSVNPCGSLDIEQYEKSLYTDEQALKAPCTARGIYFTVNHAAGIIANQVKRFVMGEDWQSEIMFDIKNNNLM